jgi:drug/metabolite transporter (DMT)-like permease
MLTATVFALASAGLHAAWNLRAKRSGDRFVALWGQFIAGGSCSLVVLIATGGPGFDALPYLAGSSLVHVVYLVGLAHAYDHGDFSLAYPVARGGGALGAAIGGALLLDDELRGWSWVAIAIVALGLFTFAPRRASWEPLARAGLVAVTIAGYTLFDSAGSRHVDDSLAYAMASFVACAVTITAWGSATGRWSIVTASLRADWRSPLWAGVASATAYALVLAAVRWAPVGYVTVLRESSVLLGPLIGTFVLHEPLGRARTRSALVVFAGMALLIATR